MTLFFSATLFISSALLFFVQPMFAKMVLPRLGGTPAVWNTCMFFFQAVLLAGYLYAHVLPGRIGTRRHALLHLLLLPLPLLVLPVALPQDAAPNVNQPVFWLLGLLCMAVGLPFFVVSTTAPLLQKWFAVSTHRAAQDPYFLYAASNLGSLLALIAYPVLVEPNLPLADHSRIWTGGYVVFVVLVAACAVWTWRATPTVQAIGARPARTNRPGPESPLVTPTRRLRWVMLAFVPSSLLLSVTNYLTTDIAAIPLLWVIPLAIYLLTFILVFARRPPISHVLLCRWQPLAVLVLTLVMLTQATEPISVLVFLHLAVFFVLAMVLHGELARDRPAVTHLTEYYLWISFGGVLGGLFNALVAPLIFSGIVEYPLMLVAACLLRPTMGAVNPEPTPQPHRGPAQTSARLAGLFRRDASMALGLGLVSLVLIVGLQSLGLEHSKFSVGLMFGLPAVICYTFLQRPTRFGLGIAALLLAGSFYSGVYGGTVYRARSYFGVHRVTTDEREQFYQLVHGNTVHGRQARDPARRPEPLTYYSRTGPVGQVFQTFADDASKANIGIVGLGAGSLAAYGRVGQKLTYYEIDPVVVRIAQDGPWFTFLRDCPADKEIIMGDARLTLAGAAPGQYGILVVDAFSSDAIPLHLLTRQALALYKSKLAEDGILAFNVSNRYLDLEPVLANLAFDAKMVGFYRHDDVPEKEQEKEGISPSQWVVLARNRRHLERIVADSRWSELRRQPGVRVWQDDFSDIFSVFKWE